MLDEHVVMPKVFIVWCVLGLEDSFWDFVQEFLSIGLISEQSISNKYLKDYIKPMSCKSFLMFRVYKHILVSNSVHYNIFLTLRQEFS